MRSRPWQTLGLKPFQMKRNRFDHFPLHFVPCRPRGDAPRKIRRVGRKSRFRFFDNHEVSHRRPACFSTLLRVPGASSSPGFPGTVTSPGFQGCLNWRCEPRCRTSNQPCASSSLITSRTLRGKASAELSANHGSQFPRTPAIVRRCDVAESAHRRAVLEFERRVLAPAESSDRFDLRLRGAVGRQHPHDE